LIGGVDNVGIHSQEPECRRLRVIENFYRHDIELARRGFVPDSFRSANVRHGGVHVAVEIESAELFRLVERELVFGAHQRESEQHREVEDRPDRDSAADEITKPDFAGIECYCEQNCRDNKSADRH
jgi:hypothetical protein